MSRSSRQKEKYVNGNDLYGDRAHEGSAARTRPLSFEDIMIRRKNKKVNDNAKNGCVDQGNLSRQNNGENVSNHSEHDGGYAHGNESVYASAKKATEGMKRSSRKVEPISLKERNSVKDGDKEIRDSETKLKVKLDKETARVKHHNSEKHSHHRSRNEEHLKDDKETSNGKDRKIESKSHHRSRNEERPRDDYETVRDKEHKNEKKSHHRSKHEKRPRDDHETRKKHVETSVGKETISDEERMRFERKSKRERQSREEGKDRLVTDRTAAKKHDSGRYSPEPAERKDSKKDTSKSHDEGSRGKKRRSGSGELRARDRSVSLSPRGHKRTYDGRGHAESSSHTSKDNQQHSDSDRNRVSSNGGQTSNQDWRHGGRGNRLGGYSPRKRRSEAAIKTPSPTTRSPERKSAGWDFPPTGTAAMSAGIIPDYLSPHQSVPTELNFSTVVPVTPNIVGSHSGASLSSISKAKDVTVDHVQLTEATRPLRRLYIENLPDSASDKSLMNSLNNFLMSSGANYIQGTQPCISCYINNEKGQALVEFLTAEDATAALSFDGTFFSSSILKIRRPKDFVDATTGVPDKSVPAADAISNIVKDSPHKIFIGGISKALSSDMLMEIASAFGHLKAYHFEVNDDLKEPCAFLEYVDQSITLKACAGLNGIKLGGRVLTVVQAVPDASVEESSTKVPFYGIPEHAKPLLLKPTKVLRLKNVFNPEDLASPSVSELEETLEDIRIECARFGTVKSINFVRCEKKCAMIDQTDERKLQDLQGDSFLKGTDTLEQDTDNSGAKSIAEASINLEEPQGKGEDLTERQCDGKPEEDFGKDEKNEVCQLDSDLVSNAPLSDLHADPNPQETCSPLDASKDKFANDAHVIQHADTSLNNSMMDEAELKQEVTKDEFPKTSLQLNHTVEGKDTSLDNSTIEEELKQEEANDEVPGTSSQLNHSVGGESETSRSDESKQEMSHDEIFEQGSVFVEYVRSEASCIAAHCLHQRVYGDRVVLVNYIPHDLYLSRFPK